MDSSIDFDCITLFMLICKLIIDTSLKFAGIVDIFLALIIVFSETFVQLKSMVKNKFKL